MTLLTDALAAYTYKLPQEAIALSPAEPRDSSRLLIYDRTDGTTRCDTFVHLSSYLPPDSLLIFNDTKVIPARIIAHLRSGGAVALLCYELNEHAHTFEALSPRRLPVGTVLTVSTHTTVRVTQVHDEGYTCSYDTGISFLSLLQTYGTTPLPPYLKQSPLSELERRTRYQSLFAREGTSAAAPTASLHFTKRLVDTLLHDGHAIGFVRLTVGLGTFAPLSDRNLTEQKLHSENYEIPKETLTLLREALRDGRPIIPVGTTALRALESASSYLEGSDVQSVFRSSTRLFIQEGYRFRIASGLITNFHVPESSLMMLVAALIGRQKLLELYTHALRNNFRFLSFGDAMLIR